MARLNSKIFVLIASLLFALLLGLEGFRQRSEFTTEVFEKQPPLDDFGLLRPAERAPEGPSRLARI
jgi:hypothetical protein